MLNFKALGAAVCVMFLAGDGWAETAEKTIDEAKLMNDLRSRDWHIRHDAISKVFQLPCKDYHAIVGYDEMSECVPLRKEIRLAMMDALLIEAKDPVFDDAEVEGGILSGIIPYVAAFGDIEVIDIILSPDILTGPGTNMAVPGLVKFGDLAIDHISEKYYSTYDIKYRIHLLFAARRLFNEGTLSKQAKQKVLSLLAAAADNPLGEIREESANNMGELSCEAVNIVKPILSKIMKSDPEVWPAIKEEEFTTYPVRDRASLALESLEKCDKRS